MENEAARGDLGPAEDAGPGEIARESQAGKKRRCRYEVDADDSQLEFEGCFQAVAQYAAGTTRQPAKRKTHAISQERDAGHEQAPAQQPPAPQAAPSFEK